MLAVLLMSSLPKRAILILVVSSVSLLAALVGGVYALAIFIENVAISGTVSSLSVRIALSNAFVIAALFLYVVKNSRGQFAYGMLEVAVGLVSNWRSLDAWFHPAVGPSTVNVLYARLAILVGGVYLIGRGISNVVEGFQTFFPISWSAVRTAIDEAYDVGYYKFNHDTPKRKLKFQIIHAQSMLTVREKS